MADEDEIVPPEMIDKFTSAAHTALICRILGMLIENGVLNQGQVVADLDALSRDLMKRPGARYCVPIVDIVRDYAAGEQERTPS